jgi:hypothetical protein
MLLLVVCLLFISVPNSVCWAQTTLRGDQLKTLNSFDKGEFGAIRVITKTWHEAFDGWNRFHISFFGYYSDPEIVRGFMQEIGIFDGSQPIEVYDWDTADCSLEKMMLIRNRDYKVYLITGSRTFVPGDTRIVPQNEPQPQIVRIFELVPNSSGSPGFPRAYFTKIIETTTGKQAVCEAADVHRMMKGIFEDFINKESNEKR